MSLSKKGSQTNNTKLSIPNKTTALNPNAAEFVPFSLRSSSSPSGSSSNAAPRTAWFAASGTIGKAVLDRSESSISATSDINSGLDFFLLFDTAFPIVPEAIQEAARNGSDVVLVDTVGRMQDKEPLMRAVSKLIYLDNPDLVLFVGEALVGNDAVDQLSKSNQKLADLSTSPSPRLIDGILLTKFDTIDDKVGAALPMAYISGVPVMFVGCGQSYTDLKKAECEIYRQNNSLSEWRFSSFNQNICWVNDVVCQWA